MASQFSFEAIGTHWQIDIEDTLTLEQEQILLKKIEERIAIFDKDYSRFRKDSLVIEMSQKPGEYVLPPDAQPMLDLYHELYKITDGYLTPLIGQTMVDAGYDAEYSLTQKKALEQPPAWDDVLDYSFPKLTLKQPVLLDFGAAGKGYLIDIVGKILEENNMSSFTIDAGGDILHHSIHHEELRIGLENPNNFGQAIGVVKINNKSICGSAGSRRKWQNFHHIIDPYKLESPKEIIATWVVADTALLADALASCLFFVAGTSLIQAYKFEYLVLKSDFSVEKSDEFPGELFS